MEMETHPKFLNRRQSSNIYIENQRYFTYTGVERMNILNFVPFVGIRKQPNDRTESGSRSATPSSDAQESLSSTHFEISERSVSGMICQPKKRQLAVAEGHPLLCYKYSLVK